MNKTVMKLKRSRIKNVVMKELLTRFGVLLSSDVIYYLNRSLNFLEVGRWMHSKGYKRVHRVDSREQLFDLVGDQVSERDVLYMEFGVFEGATTRYWSKLLHNPKSKLHGFDSFEGLPENWPAVDRSGGLSKGHFSVGGRLPQINDDRVKFFKGWFEQTLPRAYLINASGE